MNDYYAPWVEGQYYHIFNRGNNRENIFYTPRNYAYFLRKYDTYVTTYLDTYSYCLLPNHFHFLVRVKEIDVITAGNNDAIALSDGIGNVGSRGIGRDSDGLDNISAVISEQFRRFFIGYSQAINKQEGRTGSLFQKGFKRIHIDSQEHLIYLVYYIHANPQNHEIVKDFRRYLYSSYSGILIDKPTNLRKQEVVDWFGSKSEYTEFHDENQDLKDIQRFMIED